MCTWPELQTCILCMKIKSIKENETIVNTLLNQFTYKLQKKNSKQTNKEEKKQNETKQIYLIYLTWKEKKRNIQDKLSPSNDLILSLSFLFFR